MAEPVGIPDVQKVALLARVFLSPDELATLAPQLNDILAYVQQLQAVPTDGVEPTSHVLPLTNVTRRDEQTPSLPADVSVALAPARHGQLIKVPKVVDS